MKVNNRCCLFVFFLPRSTKLPEKWNHRGFCFFVKAAGAWSRLKAEKRVIFNMIELKLARRESSTVSSFRFLIGGAPDVVTPLSQTRRGFLRGKKSAVCVCSPTPVTCAFNKAEVSLMLGYETASHHFPL